MNTELSARVESNHSPAETPVINNQLYVSNDISRYIIESIGPTFQIHKSMIQSSVGDASKFVPITYVIVSNATTFSRVNSGSSASMLQTAQIAYDRIEDKLRDLADPQQENPDFEVGAAKSALKVIRNLCYHHYAPPELARQGDDAIVMLWALGDTTYAITVTDGELGYVVRRGRKAVKLVDSISVDSFRLEDMR